MSETTNRERDIMLIILGVQVSVFGAAFESVILLFAGATSTLFIFTGELRRRKYIENLYTPLVSPCHFLFDVLHHNTIMMLCVTSNVDGTR